MAKILIVDPLTLVGRELLHLLQSDPEFSPKVSFTHTQADDEHQVAELAGEPSLVAPIAGPENLASADAVLIASADATPRLDQVAEFIADNPAVPVIVIGRPSGLWERTRPAAAARPSWDSVHVRVAHPALTTLSIVIDALAGFGPSWATVAAVEPVSSRHQGDIECLARQAAQRLQGVPVEELIDGHVLAFNFVASHPDELAEEATLLFPDLSLTVTRALSGCFHGHAAHLGIGFEEPVGEAEVVDALDTDPRIAEPGLPLGLDSRAETDQVALTPPVLSPDGRLISLTAMVDGLRIGGALTALDILRSMI
jgi:aspartate-semialdehyde dehydrogenase